VKEPTFNDYERINISPAYGYFNAGILIMNTREWIKNDLTTKIFAFIRTHQSKLTFWDQDALNANLYDRWKCLPPKWNQQSALFEGPRKKLIEVYNEKELDEAWNDPAIIHYTGSSKPWDFLNLHPYRKAYFTYLRKTPWKNYTYPNVTLLKRIQKIVMQLIGVKQFQKAVSLVSHG
jgi:lipopolysaccharide biosynthesis glycosyltransferase